MAKTTILVVDDELEMRDEEIRHFGCALARR